MNTVHEQITEYYLRMERATSVEERLSIRQQRQHYYNQLSPSDKKVARTAAVPFLAKLARLIAEETDPMIQETKAVLERIDARELTKYEKATTHTTESTTRQ